MSAPAILVEPVRTPEAMPLDLLRCACGAALFGGRVYCVACVLTHQREREADAAGTREDVAYDEARQRELDDERGRP